MLPAESRGWKTRSKENLPSRKNEREARHVTRPNVEGNGILLLHVPTSIELNSPLRPTTPHWSSLFSIMNTNSYGATSLRSTLEGSEFLSGGTTMRRLIKCQHSPIGEEKGPCCTKNITEICCWGRGLSVEFWDVLIVISTARERTDKVVPSPAPLEISVGVSTPPSLPRVSTRLVSLFL